MRTHESRRSSTTSATHRQTVCEDSDRQRSLRHLEDYETRFIRKTAAGMLCQINQKKTREVCYRSNLLYLSVTHVWCLSFRLVGSPAHHSF